MTLLEYIKNYLPGYFGINPVFGEAAEVLFYTEQASPGIFNSDKFSSERERCRLIVNLFAGFPEVDDNKVEHVLNFFELLILYHKQQKHDENHQDRINELVGSTEFTAEEASIIAEPDEWWIG
jgi:hypothetical protein